MTAREPELTAPTDLCTPDGRRLSPAARGFARQPLVRANLRGSWGRTKRWDYWAILAGDVVLAVTYADVDYLGIAGVWWADLTTHESGGHQANVAGAKGVDLPDRPGSAPLRFSNRRIDLTIDDTERATHLAARWTEGDGRAASLDVAVERPPGHESLNVIIPWSDRRFQFTSKHQARPASGELRVGERTIRFGGPGRPEAWGTLDVGRGRWPYRTRWNWAGGAGRATTGEVVGLQFGGKWTEGTGATENGLIVDGVLHKIHHELGWTYRWDAPLEPWRVTSPEGRVDLVLTPRHDRHTRVEALVLGTEVHQVFGTWSGSVRTDDGRELELRGAQGFAEESRSRW